MTPDGGGGAYRGVKLISEAYFAGGPRLRQPVRAGFFKDLLFRSTVPSAGEGCSSIGRSSCTVLLISSNLLEGMPRDARQRPVHAWQPPGRGSLVAIVSTAVNPTVAAERARLFTL